MWLRYWPTDVKTCVPANALIAFGNESGSLSATLEATEQPPLQMKLLSARHQSARSG